MKHYDVIIIGAGSVGLPAAYYIAKEGFKTAVIEKLASEGRGQNRAAIGGIRATHSDPAKIKICRMTLDLMREMKELHGKEIDWIQGGYLFPVYDETTESKLKHLLGKQKKFELNIDWISPSDVETLVPGINTEGLLGGTYSPEDGSASPLKLAGAYLALARANGTDFYFNEEVISFKISENKIASVKTNKDTYTAGIVINAAGGDGREIAALARIDIPVFPDCHEAGITEAVKPFFKPMVVDIRSDDKSANYYFYQNKEGQVVFCITPNPSVLGKDIDNTSEFLPLVVKRMLNLYPRLRNLRIRRTWRGLYPMTPDGFPIVGFTNEPSNFFLAAGMCGQGFMLGPGLGVIISEIISAKTSKYDFITQLLAYNREFAGTEILK